MQKSELYIDALRTGKLKEAVVKLRTIYSIVKELKESFGIKITLKEEVMAEGEE